MVHRILAVVLELEQQLIEEVMGQPDGRRGSVEATLEAEVLLSVAKDGGDVLAGQLRGLLEVAVGLQAVQNRGSMSIFAKF
jgi:hypothetical protein